MIKLALATLCITLSFFSHANSMSFSSGTYTFSSNDDIISIKGIRYAQAPKGDLRWQSNQALVSEETFSGEQYGANCPQPFPPNSKPNMDEDCLFLNVWAPKDAQAAPVMVWIHGGGFRFGSGETEGEQLAKKGVVVVSFNYRLGPLGFIKHPLLPNSEANLGLTDMIGALQWVQTNIAKVGGDNKNVTIFGVSAGGMAVNMLLTSPNTEGLFHKAIAQSGYGTWPIERTRSTQTQNIHHWSGDRTVIAEDKAEAMFKKLLPNGVNTSDMYALHSDKLATAIEGFQLPIVDGISLKEEPAQLIARGDYRNVPIITGGNQYEGSVMSGAKITSAMLEDWFFDHTRQVESLYADDFAVSSKQGWQRMFGDLRYLLSASHTADAANALNRPIYLYLHQQVGSKDKYPLGMPHGSDAFVFWYGFKDEDPLVRDASMRMQNHWVAFARSGSPELADAPWQAYTQTHPNWHIFANQDSNSDNVLSEKLQFLKARYSARFSE